MLKQVAEAAVCLAVVAGHDDMLEVRAVADDLGEFRQQLIGDDQHPGAAVVQHEAIVVLGHQRIDRDRHGAELDGAEKCDRPIDRIEHAKQNAILAADAEGAQHAAEAIGAVGELAVGQRFPRVDEGDFRRAAGVEIALEDVGGEIVIARNRIGGRAAAGCGCTTFIAVSSQGRWLSPTFGPRQRIMAT